MSLLSMNHGPASGGRAATRTIDLDHEQMLVFDNGAGTRMQVLYGGVWLTEPDSGSDHVAGPGQWLRVERRGRAVAEALGPTRVRLHAPWRSETVAWRSALQRWATRARGALAGAAGPRAVALALALVVSIGMPDLLARAFQGTPAGVLA